MNKNDKKVPKPTKNGKCIFRKMNDLPIFSEKILKRAFLLIGQFLIGQNFRLESSIVSNFFQKFSLSLKPLTDPFGIEIK